MASLVSTRSAVLARDHPRIPRSLSGRVGLACSLQRVYTPMLALIGPRDGGHLDVEALAARLSNPVIRAVARPIGFETPMDLLGQYIGGPHTLAAFAGEGPRNTDDYPFVMLDATRNVRALSAPPSASLLALTRATRPDPADVLAASTSDAERLAAYWRARNRFLEVGASLKG